jgi:hypothetical protein
VWVIPTFRPTFETGLGADMERQEHAPHPPINPCSARPHPGGTPHFPDMGPTLPTYILICPLDGRDEAQPSTDYMLAAGACARAFDQRPDPSPTPSLDADEAGLPTPPPEPSPGRVASGKGRGCACTAA